MPVTLSGGAVITGGMQVTEGGSPDPTPSGATNFGYTAGGDTSPSNYSNVIDKFPFSSDGNATDVGDLLAGLINVAGQSSSTNGYTSGGTTLPGVLYDIQKHSFTSDGNATDVGDLTVTRRQTSGQSSSTNGYNSGGSDNSRVIDKFPFASDGDATDVGDLVFPPGARSQTMGHNSADNGYVSGGFTGPGPQTSQIDKFPFATDSNSADVGDLTRVVARGSGQSSSDNGYVSGGRSGSTQTTNVIEKWPFASDGNASDVGDLTISNNMNIGQSSTTNGYSSGGNTNPSPPQPRYNVIDKFPFASDGNATDVGDLTLGRAFGAGSQY